ncbi:MAG: hypothetical protein IIZ78_19570 [Clostridiales bacterium]|nr:hypothetical protein [Clostridiales bacterium]
MAISVNLYKNPKKVNSTKLPIAGAGTIGTTCQLKDVTNLYTPGLIFSVDLFTDGQGNIKNPLEYNYAYIADFSRYYFIRSWSWILGRWEASLEIDVLASFRSTIGNTSAYVLRSASAWDPDVVDTKYPVKASDSKNPYQVKSYISDGTNSPWNTNIYNANIQEGCFVISVVNNDSGAIGGVSHYALSARMMAELLNKLYSSPSWMNITDGNISQDLQKMLINPMQYITSAAWLPCGYDTSGAVGISTIPYGWWSVSLSSGVAYRIDVGHIQQEFNMSFAVAQHPQRDAKKRWLQLSPFTAAALYFPPFGMLSLDTSKIYGAEYIDCNIKVDLITGRGVLNISSHSGSGASRVDGGVFYSTTAQVGVPVSIAQMSVDWGRLSSTSTYVGAAGIALATGNLQESLSNLGNNLISGIKGIFAKKEPAKIVGGSSVGYGPGGHVFGGSHGTFGGVGNPTYTSELSHTDMRVGGESETSLLDSIKSIASDIGSAVLAISGTCQSTGTTGGFAALTETCYIQWFFQRIVDQDPDHYGYPLCSVRKINTLSGFVLCANEGDLEVAATPAERQAITALMEAGFYYE